TISKDDLEKFRCRALLADHSAIDLKSEFKAEQVGKASNKVRVREWNSFGWISGPISTNSSSHACHVSVHHTTLNAKLDDKIRRFWEVKELVELRQSRTFGSKIFVLDKDSTKDKLSARSFKGIFVGYPREIKGFRVWTPSKHKTIVARDVQFLEEINNISEDSSTLDNLAMEDTSRMKNPPKII
ncbi:Copia protein, partial [Trachymyrmex cornetzi]